MSEILRSMADAFDGHLLNVLKKGRVVLLPDGSKEQVEATAADLNVIRQRLKDCGVTAMVDDASPIRNIVEEMKRRNLRVGSSDAECDRKAV